MNQEPDIQTVIRQRRSVRTYQNRPLTPEDLTTLDQMISDVPQGPWEAHCRFKRVAVQPDDTKRLRRLGTYGMIKNPAGFIIGVSQDTRDSLLQFGYQMETLILGLTRRNIGTCWLGGSLQKSRFMDEIGGSGSEILPAAVSFGYPTGAPGIRDRIVRFNAGSDRRKPWEELFFLDGFDTGLSPLEGEMMHAPLEMTRLAPSASNRQPWRIVKESGKNQFHFYIQRNSRYQNLLRLGGIPDLQLIDLGIAVCHFDQSLRMHQISGQWSRSEPGIECPDSAEYIISWSGQ